MPNSKIFSSRSNFFDKRLPELLEREKLRIKVLEEMKKETENENLKECTFKPKITKNFLSQTNLTIQSDENIKVVSC